MILDKIVESTKECLAKKKAKTPLGGVRQEAESIEKTECESFCKSVVNSAKGPNGVGLIAEIKKASPSKGLIRESFEPGKIALEYQDAKAAAISVLTEERHFLGHLDYLKEVRKEVSTPILRKDFTIDEYQIYEAKVAGADAVLLIAAILSKEQIKEYIDLSESLALNYILEIHNFKEMEKALDTQAATIGVNNRNLNTFEVDIKTSVDISRELPEEILKISESGIFTGEDVKILKNAGYSGILVGESLMRSSNIKGKIEELLGV